MARLAVSAAMLSALAAGPALAGDRALIDFIGYSGDARYFAFEEFGIQDGSGFPFSTIYIVDLPNDSWVSGSPYRVQADSEEIDLADTRDEAFALAEAKLDELDISEAAFPIVVNADGELGDIGHEVVFGNPSYGLGEPNGMSRLTLTEFDAQPGTDCSIIENKVFGFSLSVDETEIYADPAKLPASRGCAQGYRIYAVVRPAEWSGTVPREVAIISSYPFGFEGPDRRFLAVPLGN